jgi:hypothetical protein
VRKKISTNSIQKESPQARLPGKIFCRRGRWWWRAQLPGQAAPRSRALKPEGARYATSDRQLADQIAFAMWQEALRAESEAKVKAERAARMHRLKLRYHERMNALRDRIGSAEARAEAESAARARLQAALDELRSRTPQTAPCECCGSRVPDDQLQRIDSGQRLCASCLDMLRQTTRREPTPPGPDSPENCEEEL